VTVSGPEWTDADRAYALAWQEEQRFKCGGCGRSRVETMTKNAQGQFQAKAWYCHACAARDRAAEKAANAPGLYWSVAPTGRNAPRLPSGDTSAEWRRTGG
jgi:hypothetical protein